MKYKALCIELAECLNGLINTPAIIDRATIPKAGINAAPKQVVFNHSISYSRILHARELIKKAGVKYDEY